MTVRTKAKATVASEESGAHCEIDATSSCVLNTAGSTFQTTSSSLSEEVDMDAVVGHAGYEVDSSGHLSVSSDASNKQRDPPPSTTKSNHSGSSSFVTLSDLLGRPYIQDIFARGIVTPLSVLSFFFGVNYGCLEDIEENLANGAAMLKMPPLWFGGGTEYDSLCFIHFADIVRQLKRGDSQGFAKDGWTTTVDGVMAVLILSDQISRNAFRGTSEAFSYDQSALIYARQLSNHIFSMYDVAESNSKCQVTLEGTMYPPYMAVVMMALMHSEDIRDHENALRILQLAIDRSPPSLSVWWDQQEAFELDHKKVIDRFGRYPHRNNLIGRETTEDEARWLADEDNLPGWARSQG